MDGPEKLSQMVNEMLGGKPSRAALEAAKRQGVEAGFALAVRQVARLARQEGYVAFAARVEGLKLVKK